MNEQLKKHFGRILVVKNFGIDFRHIDEQWLKCKIGGPGTVWFGGLCHYKLWGLLRDQGAPEHNYSTTRMQNKERRCCNACLVKNKQINFKTHL